MKLAQFAFDVYEPVRGTTYHEASLLTRDQSDRVGSLSRFCGHIYAESLGDYRTPATWKVMYCFIPDHFGGFPFAMMQATNQAGGVGVGTFYERGSLSELEVLWRDDTRACEEVLRRIHKACIEIARYLNWGTEPLEAAFAGITTPPSLVRARAWKFDRRRRFEARLLLEEQLGPVIATIELRSPLDASRVIGQCTLPFHFVSGAWSQTRDIVWERDEIVLRMKDSTEVLRVDAVSPELPQS